MEAFMNDMVANTAFSMGSTVYHAAVPPRSTSNRRSGEVPQDVNTPPLRKPAVLATYFPDLSQGTLGMAISADLTNMGTMSSRTRGNGFSWFTCRLKQMLTLLYCFILRYLWYAIRLIFINRKQVSRSETLLCAAVIQFVRDRRHAVFRRRAVRMHFTHSPYPLQLYRWLPTVGRAPVQQDAVTVAAGKTKLDYTT